MPGGHPSRLRNGATSDSRSLHVGVALSAGISGHSDSTYFPRPLDALAGTAGRTQRRLPESRLPSCGTGGARPFAAGCSGSIGNETPASLCCRLAAPGRMCTTSSPARKVPTRRPQDSRAPCGSQSKVIYIVRSSDSLTNCVARLATHRGARAVPTEHAPTRCVMPPAFKISASSHAWIGHGPSRSNAAGFAESKLRGSRSGHSTSLTPRESNLGHRG